MLAAGSSSSRPARPPSTCFDPSNDGGLPTAGAIVLPDFVTPGELIARLGERLEGEPRLLAETEREVLAGVGVSRGDRGRERTSVPSAPWPRRGDRSLLRFAPATSEGHRHVRASLARRVGTRRPRRSWRRTSRAPDAVPRQRVPPLRTARRRPRGEWTSTAFVSDCSRRRRPIRGNTSCSLSATPRRTATGCARLIGICCRDFLGSRGWTSSRRMLSWPARSTSGFINSCRASRKCGSRPTTGPLHLC